MKSDLHRTSTNAVNALEQKKIALIDWSFLLEDYLHNIGSTVEDFCTQTTGGWMFGYIEALKTKKVETTLVCFSSLVNKVQRHHHQPTGATILILPSSRKYRWSRKLIPNPYANTLIEAAGEIPTLKKPFYNLIRHLSHYWATPTKVLTTVLKNEKADLILCQEYENPRFDICVQIAKRLNLPIFATFQGGNWQMSVIEKFIRPFSLRNCSGFIAGAAEEINRLNEKYKIHEKKIAKIVNPIDLSTWVYFEKQEAREALQIPIHAQVVIWHGRIDYYRKGLDILLSAWELLSAERENKVLQLIIIGNGNDAIRLRRHLSRIRSNNILWVDEYINDKGKLSQYLHAADIYVFPSRHEGFPVAPIEAMACGLPIVACNASGIKEIIGEGKNSAGIFVNNEDHLALKEGLKLLLYNNDLWTELGIKARKRAYLYSSEAVGAQLLQFLFKPVK